jgi:hypothetical protein
MVDRLLLACLVLLGGASWLVAAEPFDAAPFVQSLREPPPIEMATRDLEALPDRFPVHFMDFSPDGKTLCAVHNNGVIAAWTVETGKLLWVKRILASKLRAQVGAQADIFVISYALSQDHKRAAMMLRGGDVVFWDIDKQEAISVLDAELKPAHVNVVLTSTGKHALLGTFDHGVAVVDVDTGKKVFVHDAAKSPIQFLGISPDDRWAMFAEKDSRVHTFPLLGGPGGTAEVRLGRPIVHFKATNMGAYFMTDTNQLHQTEFNAERTYNMRAGFQARLVISATSNCMVIYDRHANLEIRSLWAPGSCWHRNLADDPPRMVAIASDFRTLAFETKEATKLKVLSDDPEHPSRRAARKIFELFENEDFNALRAIGKQLHEEQDQSFAFAPLEAPIDFLIDTLAAHFQAEELTTKWLAEQPDALLPKLVMANFYVGKAWESRGGDIAARVTKEGWRGFHENIAQAQAILAPLVAKQNAPGPARSCWLVVAMAQSQAPAKWMPHADWMVANAPTYQRGHRTVMQMSLRRWGGAPGASAAHAARVADAIGGGEGDGHYAQFWLSFYDRHDGHFSIVEELDMDRQRVLRGLLHLAETSPHAVYFAHRGLQISRRERDWDKARAFYDKLRDPRKNWEIGWWRNPAELEDAIRYVTST